MPKTITLYGYVEEVRMDRAIREEDALKCLNAFLETNDKEWLKKQKNILLSGYNLAKEHERLHRRWDDDANPVLSSRISLN